ncbi:CPBP family intramembrane glutamic endopeptidase [Pseudalkalibacillus caeni]|uniref:CPBP family intramembrane metalloprotease n=1 Tax=Exobacillus caeni TaxID=2574798 RepID=A0A5R9F8R8_9BACL|nr:type II CAAX endopeptidase family protein [Pseudalkalibacillus caeni]TLS37243.1 CPBP family intramembrane metalloprotease [Pseudalkalibacillus caeni]
MENPFRKIKFWKLILWMVAGFILFAIADIGLDLAGFRHEEVSSTAFSIYFYLINFLWIVYSLKKADIGLSELIGRSSGPVSWKKYAGLTLMQVLVSIWAIFTLFYFVSLVFPDWVLDTFNAVEETPETFEGIIIELVTIVLIAPFVEEILFRGILLHKLSAKLSLKTSVVISSLIFAALHMNEGFVGQFMGGILLAIFYIETKNLWVSIACHSLNNLIAGIFMFLPGDPGAVASLSELQQGTFIAMIAGLPFLVGMVVYYVKTFRKQNWDIPYKVEKAA